MYSFFLPFLIAGFLMINQSSASNLIEDLLSGDFKPKSKYYQALSTYEKEEDDKQLLSNISQCLANNYHTLNDTKNAALYYALAYYYNPSEELESSFIQAGLSNVKDLQSSKTKDTFIKTVSPTIEKYFSK